MGRPNRTSPGCTCRASPLAPLAPPRRERSPAQATAPRFAREPELATARSATAAPARGSGRALRPSDVLTRCLRKSHLESVGPTRRGDEGHLERRVRLIGASHPPRDQAKHEERAHPPPMRAPHGGLHGKPRLLAVPDWLFPAKVSQLSLSLEKASSYITFPEKFVA